MLNPDDRITVCSACLRSSCWQGIFFCEKYLEAGTVDKTVEELRRLNLEHEDWWIETRINDG